MEIERYLECVFFDGLGELELWVSNGIDCIIIISCRVQTFKLFIKQLKIVFHELCVKHHSVFF